MNKVLKVVCTKIVFLLNKKSGLCDLGRIPGSDNEAFKKLENAILYNRSKKSSLIYVEMYLALHKKDSKTHRTTKGIDVVESRYFNKTGALILYTYMNKNIY